MRFTQFKFDPAAVAADVQEKRAALKVNKGLSDLGGYAAGVIRRRLEEKPAKYREFGPYWWAVKKALNEAGADFGDTFDVLVASEYTGRNMEETLVMGEAFKDICRATYFVGNNLFALDADGVEQYELFDPDMEARA
jgi:hypothetical protein